MKKKKTSFNLTEEFYNELKNASEKFNITMSELIHISTLKNIREMEQSKN